MSRSLSQKEMEMIEDRMRKRTERLAQKCTEFGLNIRQNDSLHKPNPWEFLVNKRYHLVWCNVFKAASTSWMYNFNILAGYSPEFLRKSNIVPLELARRRYERVKLPQVQYIFWCQRKRKNATQWHFEINILQFRIYFWFLLNFLFLAGKSAERISIIFNCSTSVWEASECLSW